jgi:hypothetical protein
MTNCLYSFRVDICHQFRCNIPIMVARIGLIPCRWSEKHASIYTALWSLHGITLLWFSAHAWLPSRSLKALQTWDFFLPATRPVSARLRLAHLTFKIHCSVLPARRPSRLRFAPTLRYCTPIRSIIQCNNITQYYLPFRGNIEGLHNILYQSNEVRPNICLLCNTGMRHITTFRSTTDRIYDSGPIRLWYCNIIILTIVLQLPTVFSTVTCCTGL